VEFTVDSNGRLKKSLRIHRLFNTGIKPQQTTLLVWIGKPCRMAEIHDTALFQEKTNLRVLHYSHANDELFFVLEAKSRKVPSLADYVPQAAQCIAMSVSLYTVTCILLQYLLGAVSQK
jgi:hypothetical protein